MPQALDKQYHQAHDEEVGDDCVRTISIVVADKDGKQEQQIPLHALFNKSQSGNFMALDFVERYNLSSGVTKFNANDPLPLLLAADGIKVHGQITCRWVGYDKPCSNKLVFFPPKFISSSFVVISSQSSFGVTIGRDTIAYEQLDQDPLHRLRKFL